MSRLVALGLALSVLLSIAGSAPKPKGDKPAFYLQQPARELLRVPRVLTVANDFHFTATGTLDVTTLGYDYATSATDVKAA